MNNIKDKFELEFCLSKEAYMNAYNEDDFLWNKLHQESIDSFHVLFKTEEGKQQINGDIRAINLVFFKTREKFLNGFNKEEFSDEEYDFLRYFITNSFPFLNENIEV